MNLLPIPRKNLPDAKGISSVVYVNSLNNIPTSLISIFSKQPRNTSVPRK